MLVDNTKLQKATELEKLVFTNSLKWSCYLALQSFVGVLLQWMFDHEQRVFLLGIQGLFWLALVISIYRCMTQDLDRAQVKKAIARVATLQTLTLTTASLSWDHISAFLLLGDDSHSTTSIQGHGHLMAINTIYIVGMAVCQVHIITVCPST